LTDLGSLYIINKQNLEDSHIYDESQGSHVGIYTRMTYRKRMKYSSKRSPNSTKK